MHVGSSLETVLSFSFFSRFQWLHVLVYWVMSKSIVVVFVFYLDRFDILYIYLSLVVAAQDDNVFLWPCLLVCSYSQVGLPMYVL